MVAGVIKAGDQAHDLADRWHVAGDTLVFTDPVVRAGDSVVSGINGANALRQSGGAARRA